MSVADASESHLGYLLRSAGQLTLVLAALRTVCRWAAILFAAVLVAIVVDGLLGLRPWVLAATDAVLIGLAGAGFVVLVRTIATHWFDPRRAARVVESRLGLSDGRLVNAWDLAAAPPKHASPQLVGHSVKLANEFAQSVPLSETVQSKPLVRTTLVLGAVLLLGLAGFLAMPRLFAAVLPRLAQPWGDHPPFTLVQFNVSSEPDPVFHGRAATIIARPGRPRRDRPRERGLRCEVSAAGDDAHASPSGRGIRPADRQARKRAVSSTSTHPAAAARSTASPSCRYRRSKRPTCGTSSRSTPPGPKPATFSTPAACRPSTGTSVKLTVTSNVPLKSGIARPHAEGEGQAAGDRSRYCR